MIHTQLYALNNAALIDKHYCDNYYPLSQTLIQIYKFSLPMQ